LYRPTFEVVRPDDLPLREAPPGPLVLVATG
jgi:hypothetical protein